MKDLYAWPRVTRELFSPVGRDVFVDRAKNQTARSAAYHHYHESYELYYLYAGDRLYHISGKTYRIARGSFVLIRPWEIHSTGVADPTGYDRFLLHFSREYVEKLLTATPGGQLARNFLREGRVVSVDFAKQGFVEALLAQMLEEYQAKPQGFEEFLEASSLQLLMLLARSQDATDASEQSDADTAHKTVAAAVAYINAHYAEPLSLGEMAARFFVSPGYFSHAFKRITGISFIKYINGIRIREAQRLLRSKSATVTATAEAVGYTSTTHFGRVFKEITGLSPLEYKMRGK